jgi:endonuclease/exonuclease/phosphatase family metal-dependent hydrolase
LTLKVLTYNIRHGKGLDGRVSLERVAGVIAGAGADLVALQEVDGYSPRTGFRSQAASLGRRLGMEYFFGATIKKAGVPVFGNAILSKLQVSERNSWDLPGKGEPRGLIEAVSVIDGVQFSFFTTHLGLSIEARTSQVGKITELLGGTPRPFILAGDFNCLPDAEELAPLWAFVRDTAAGGARPLFTYPAHEPRVRIDFILVSPQWTLREVGVLKCDASDHLPVFAAVEQANAVSV